MKKIAIVILNWNGAHMMRTYLPTVIKNTPETEIIIADNPSIDADFEELMIL